MLILDCTLRDGGYYNNWNFPHNVVEQYLQAMDASDVDIVELGLRSLKNKGFKGAAAFSTDEYLNTLPIPSSLRVAVMVNASELINAPSIEEALETLFPHPANMSRVDVVRIACHVHEFESALPACKWLKERGFIVGFNLMQVAERTQAEVEALARAASSCDIDVLYFADSMGSMGPDHCATTISWLRSYWNGALGIHTHDNMGKALQNTLKALDEGVSWLDATVTGMGRGPGNARTEELVIEVAERKEKNVNIVPLMALIKSYFQPLKNKYGWGTNPFYYLSGKYGIHPTFIQEMLSDPRYNEEDIIATIEHLHTEGGSKFSFNMLDESRNPFKRKYDGEWSPKNYLADREVLILGAGPSLDEHKTAIEAFIGKCSPIVIAMNAQSALDEQYVDLRIASHPVRLLADYRHHLQLPQPLVAPLSSLPKKVKDFLSKKTVYDFAIDILEDTFALNETSATIPNALVISYGLAVAAAGAATKIYLAGFDGFGPGDSRTQEMQKVFNSFTGQVNIPVISITSTEYDIPTISVYGV